MGIKVKYISIFLIGLCTLCAMGQGQNPSYHSVQAGETVYGISRQYSISIEELTKANPAIANGLKVGDKLLIPKTTITTRAKERGFVYHRVEAKETLYSLRRKYAVTQEVLLKHNPFLADGLKVGQTLKIPEKSKKVITAKDPSDFYYHQVRAQETAYSLSKQYKISLDSLYALNPSVKNGLRIGQDLKLPLNRKPEVTKEVEAAPLRDGLADDKPFAVEESELAQVLEETDTTEKDSSDYFLYQVKAGDSFYTLKGQHGVERSQLLALNPELAAGLTVGKYIIIPTKKAEQSTGFLDRLFGNEEEQPNVSVSERDQEKKELLNNPDDTLELVVVDEKDTVIINTAKNYKVGLMLPFEAPTIDLDVWDTSWVPAPEEEVIEVKLKMSSKVALEFYNGFMMAADTLSKLGMNLTLDIYDTKKSLNRTQELVSEMKGEELDLVVGPLFKENVEYVASALQAGKVPVISPLSNTVSVEGLKNLVQNVPDQIAYSYAIAQLLNSKYPNDQILFAYSGDTKEREQVKQIKAMLLPRDDDSNLVRELVLTEETLGKYELREMLSYDRKNIVVIASENPVYLSDIVNNLRRLRDTSLYLIGSAKLFQMNTLEASYLDLLNLTAPDIGFTDYNDSVTEVFISEYRAMYGAEPSRFAFQGYDVGMFYLGKLWKSDMYFFNNLEVKSEYVPLYRGFKLEKTESGGWLNRHINLLNLQDLKLVKLPYTSSDSNPPRK